MIRMILIAVLSAAVFTSCKEKTPPADPPSDTTEVDAKALTPVPNPRKPDNCLPCDDPTPKEMAQIVARADIRKAVIASYEERRAAYLRHKKLANQTALEKGAVKQFETIIPKDTWILGHNGLLCIEVTRLNRSDFRKYLKVRRKVEREVGIPTAIKQAYAYVVWCMNDNPDSKGAIPLFLDKKGQLLKGD